MTSALLYAGAGVVLFAVALLALFLRRHLLRKLMAANIAGSGVFLFLLGTAADGDAPPDPVPQAMVLTGIVVTVSVTAYGVALLRRFADETGRDTLTEDGGGP